MILHSYTTKKKALNGAFFFFMHEGELTMNDCLQHHGIKGQKWGLRRFQEDEERKRRDRELERISRTHIEHSGVKNMKWGIRRFQNEDGTYTEEGKARRRIGYIDDETKDKIRSAFEPNIKGGKDKPKQSAAEKLTRTAGTLVDDATDLANAISDIMTRNSGKSSDGMSDDELRRAINRLQMEQQYSNLTKRSTGKGMQVVKDILSVAGPLAAVAASSATVASTVYLIKNKGKVEDD